MYAEETYEKGAPVIDGFTGGQRFFLSTAQQSRTVATEDALRNMALHESHPPAEFRVNGILRNLDEWYREFHVDSSAVLFLPKDDRIRLW